MISHFWLGLVYLGLRHEARGEGKADARTARLDLRQADVNLCQSFASRTYFVFVSHLFFEPCGWSERLAR